MRVQRPCIFAALMTSLPSRHKLGGGVVCQQDATGSRQLYSTTVQLYSGVHDNCTVQYKCTVLYSGLSAGCSRQHTDVQYNCTTVRWCTVQLYCTVVCRQEATGSRHQLDDQVSMQSSTYKHTFAFTSAHTQSETNQY